MLASQRSEPFSMSQSETPAYCRMCLRLRQTGVRLGRGAQVGSADDLDQRRADSVEVDEAALVRVHALAGVLLEVDALELAVAIAVDGNATADAERLVELADLVALRQVGIEVVLAVELRDRRCTSPSSASAARIATRSACSLSTGRTPGRPMSTGETRVLGSPPESLGALENSLLTTSSWQCTSRPMTGSYEVMAPAPAW